MNRREFISFGTLAAAGTCLADAVPVVTPEELASADFDAALKVIWSTTLHDEEKRKDALAVLQKHIYAMKTGLPFLDALQRGLAIPAGELAELYAKYPVIRWTDEAFDKVVRELRETKVTGDVPAVWYLYNMGVVVKTKTCAFAIDVCHRKAAELAPYLDFAMCTHAHGDHYTDAFVAAMRKLNKPFISNFVLIWNWYCNEAVKDFEIKGVRIHVTQTDHNEFLPKSMLCYEVFCPGDRPFVLYHTGDTNRASQIEGKLLTREPDLFFAHCAIGFSFPEACRKSVQAKLTVPLHHQELGHLGGRWRCVGFHEEPARIIRELRTMNRPVAMPVWGDRIV